MHMHTSHAYPPPQSHDLRDSSAIFSRTVHGRRALLLVHDDVRIGAFDCGAFPSKLLHFACDVLVGIEAGSLAAALDAHDDLPAADDLEGRDRARKIAVGTMGLTVLFVCGMLHTMHSALKEMRAKEEARDLLPPV